MEGQIPSFFDALKLDVLWIHNNNFDDLLQLTHIGQANDSVANFRFENNRFTFEDILPNISLFDANDEKVNYVPQQPFYKDTTIVAAPGSDIELLIDIDPDVTSNVYSWEKSGSLWNQAPSAILEIQEINSEDEGVYQLLVNNPLVPKLTLKSREITVISGSTSTSEISGFTLHVYPNPVPVNHNIILQWEGNADFKGKLFWMASNGQIIDSELIITNSEKGILSISAPSHPGLYILQLRSEDGQQNHYKIAVY